jgi:hypothetical protein
MSNRIDITLNDEAITGIAEAMEAIRGYLAFNAGLTPDGSKSLSRIDTRRYAFVKLAFELAEVNAYVRSPFINHEESKRDFTAFEQLGLIESALLELTSKVNDLRGLTGHESYMYALAIYEQSQSAMKKGVPGAKAVYEQLKPFFEKQGTKKSEKK